MSTAENTVVCARCRGTGIEPKTLSVVCQQCKGSGWIVSNNPPYPGRITRFAGPEV